MRRGPLRILSLVFTGLVLACSSALAQTYVDDDCPLPEMGTQALPYCTIQAAICAIKDTGGGTILVEPGTYMESLRMFPGISVISTGGPTVTTIDAAGQPCTQSDCLPSTTNLTCSAIVWGSGSPPSDRPPGLPRPT